MSLVTKQPIANAGTVRILVNDEFFIPNSGFFSSASLTSALSGPYDIVPTADVLTITTPTGTQTLSFGLQTLTRYTASQLASQLLKLGLDGDTVFVDVSNDHLTLTDMSSVGASSFIQVGGSAAVSLGFGAPGSTAYQWRARGTQIYPSWILQSTTESQRYPKFSQPIKGNPVFKVTYATSGARCRRCGGTYVENDIRFDSQGQSLMIANEDLLYQASLKLLLTDKGSNPYHPQYGTNLRARIGSKAVSGVATLINEDVRKGLAELQSLQKEQSKYQEVTYKERLYAISNVTVAPHSQDPSTFLVDVTVRNASSDPITLSIVYTVPQVVALMGSNGLMLGPESSAPIPGQLPTTWSKN